LVILIQRKTKYTNNDIKYIEPKVSELNRRKNEPLDAMQEAKNELDEQEDTKNVSGSLEMVIRSQNNQIDRSDTPLLFRPRQSGQQRDRISKYGQLLFDHFCDNETTNWICINNYELIPSSLKIALLMEKKDNVYNISFVKLLKLFTCLESVTLNELDIKQLTEQSKLYVNAVANYMNEETMKSNESKSEIFKSELKKNN